MNCYGKERIFLLSVFLGVESFPNMIKFNCLQWSITPTVALQAVLALLAPRSYPHTDPSQRGLAPASLRLPAGWSHWEELGGEGMTGEGTVEDSCLSHSAMDRPSSILFPPQLHIFWTDSCDNFAGSSGSRWYITHPTSCLSDQG